MRPRPYHLRGYPGRQANRQPGSAFRVSAIGMGVTGLMVSAKQVGRNTWLELSEKDGFTALLFSHWILGEEARNRQPRWSILRNVLGWGK